MGRTVLRPPFSDLLEPILYVAGEESSAHYCFTHLLQRSGPKFDRSAETGIEAYMSKLRSLLAYEEPEMGEHLRFLDADHLFFTYRWFLLDFKREFEKEDVLKIWESIWACEILHSEHFTVFIALVVLQEHRTELLQCANSTDLLRLFNAYRDSKLVANVVRLSPRIATRFRHNHPSPLPFAPPVRLSHGYPSFWMGLLDGIPGAHPSKSAGDAAGHDDNVAAEGEFNSEGHELRSELGSDGARSMECKPATGAFCICIVNAGRLPGAPPTDKLHVPHQLNLHSNRRV